MKPYLAELVRGYETSEFSHPTRSRADNRLDLTPWLTESESASVQSRIALYAERNGELHVLCHEMLTALEYLGCEYEILHKFRERLHNVPQCRYEPTD